MEHNKEKIYNRVREEYSDIQTPKSLAHSYAMQQGLEVVNKSSGDYTEGDMYKQLLNDVKKYNIDTILYTVDENIFIAKKMLSEIIYNSAYVEGCNVTFPQTETILQGMVINNVSVNDIQTVLNLRDAWRYILSIVKDLKTVDLDFINKVNEYISRNESLSWGTLRTGNIGVSGTNYIPPIPEEQNVKDYLKNIDNIKNPMDRALIYFLSATKNQFYWDGNKRTSIVVANAILIANGCGILTIDKDNAIMYNELLTKLYNSKESGMDLTEPITSEFVSFLKNEIMRITEKFELSSNKTR